MNSDDDNHNRDDNLRDADNFHIAPEYGEQGEGPGEQPVRRVANTSDGFKKPVSINITEIKSEKVESSPSDNSPFNHGEDDVMQYFTTEKIEEEISSEDSLISDMSISGSSRNNSNISYSGGSGGHDRGVAAEPRDDGREERASREEIVRGVPQGLSAQSSDASMASTPKQATPRKKKKSSLVSTIAIVLITVLITAVAVFAILVLTQGSSKTNQVSTAAPAKVETDSVTCVKSDASDDEKSAAGDATAINTTVIANYTSGDMDDYSVVKRYTYDSASAAEAGLKKVKSAYMDRYVAMLDLNVDPFSSTYAQKDKEVTESHFAAASDITSENIDLINIPKGNDTTPDISVVESVLKTSGYTCKIKSAE